MGFNNSFFSPSDKYLLAEYLKVAGGHPAVAPARPGLRVAAPGAVKVVAVPVGRARSARVHQRVGHRPRVEVVGVQHDDPRDPRARRIPGLVLRAPLQTREDPEVLVLDVAQGEGGARRTVDAAVEVQHAHGHPQTEIQRLGFDTLSTVATLADLPWHICFVTGTPTAAGQTWRPGSPRG